MGVVTLTLALALALYGQGALEPRLVEPQGVSRTQHFAMRAGDAIVLRPVAVASSDFTLAVEVYDESRTLVGRDDDEVDVSAFEWEAPRDGRDHLLVRNFSAVRGVYSLKVGPSGRSRGVQPVATNAVVKVFYATNRSEMVQAGGSVAFTGEPRGDDQIAFGVAHVSIPRDHRMGELEGPSILRLEFRADPDCHIVLKRTESLPPQRFFSTVATTAQRSPRREAFVFVHGFAVTFEDAARRTAQISSTTSASRVPRSSTAGPRTAVSVSSITTATGGTRKSAQSASSSSSSGWSGRPALTGST